MPNETPNTSMSPEEMKERLEAIAKAASGETEPLNSFAADTLIIARAISKDFAKEHPELVFHEAMETWRAWLARR